MKPELLPPLTNKPDFAFQILQNVLFQLMATPESDRANQRSLLQAMATLNGADRYIKHRETETEIVWGHPSAPDDANRQITYRFSDNTCQVSYGDNANAAVWVMPNDKGGVQLYSIHNAHYHKKGADRNDVALDAPRQKCSPNPTNATIKPLQQQAIARAA